jgi:hypothetical protein
VQFVYIIAASILIGALLIAVTTLGLDTKRMLKLRGMRKELTRLQQALQEAQALHEAKVQEEQEIVTQVEEESSEVPVSGLASPEEISKSFEDTIEKDDFLEASKKRREEQEEEKDLVREGTDIRERVTGASDAKPSEQEVEAENEPKAGTEEGSFVNAEVEQEGELVEEAPGESEAEEVSVEAESKEIPAQAEPEDAPLETEPEETPVEAEIVEREIEEEEQEQRSDKRNV